MRPVLVIAAIAVVGWPAAARAQDHPFVFSVTTASDTSKPHVRVDYDFGMGEQTFRQNVQSGPEQQLGIQASTGRLTFIGRVGLATGATTYETSNEAELLVSVVTPGARGVSLAVGGGLLHEAGGGNVLIGRVVAGRLSERTRLDGNLVLQKAFEPGRDRLDLVTTAGWAARLNGAVSLGAEAIGEDLEGFWNPNEAEGGARILIGPSIHVAPPDRHWQVSLAGGPTFHPTTSGRTSDAFRDLPQTTRHGTGYALRLSFACVF
jgi:hypothetical protein